MDIQLRLPRSVLLCDLPSPAEAGFAKAGAALRCAARAFRFPALACLLLAAACTTSYHARGFFGAGFSEQRVAPDIWIVSFDGSAFTPRERVQAFLMMRCAEITVENGASFFSILSTGAPARRRSTSPSLIDQAPFPTDHPPEPEFRVMRFARAAIQLHKEKPEEKAYDARELLRQLSLQAGSK